MPNTFQPISASGDAGLQASQINANFRKLDNESVVKVFKNGDQNAIINGRYQTDPNRYGQLFYDEDGVPRILIGQAPDDGRPGVWISDDGQNVLELLGG